MHTIYISLEGQLGVILGLLPLSEMTCLDGWDE